MTKNLITHNIYFYLLGLLPFVFTIIGNLLGGYYVGLNLILVLILIPLDSLWKVNKTSQKHTPYIYGILISIFVLQVIGMESFLTGFTDGRINNSNLLLGILSNGLMMGLGITVAGHELIHSKPKWAKNLGILSFFLSLYAFHYVEHIQGHHKNVSQSIDPTSAKLNQSFYNYFFVGVWKELVHGFNIEAKRLKEKSAWSLNNFVVRWNIIQVLFVGAIFYFFGIIAGFSFLAVSLIAVAYHYIVMFTQHYGLQRGDGDRTLAEHSWQNNSWISEYFALGFTNHSEHHTRVTKGYSEITYLENGPNIGTGYFGIIPLVLIPSLWQNKANKIIAKLK